jgi:hypothetical protein
MNTITELSRTINMLMAHPDNEPNSEFADRIDSLIDLKEQLTLTDVSNWVAISSTEQPEIMTDVMVKYKDGRKEVAFFDGDKRFYIEKDDRDVTETIVEWHKLP